jgi:hypothetical protein
MSVHKQWVVLSLLMLLLSGQGLVYVDGGASMGASGGTSWGNAFTDFQSALDNTASGEIWLAVGTYQPSAYSASCTGCATDRDFTFQLKDSVNLYGGFAGTEGSFSERDIAMNPTVLSGDIEAVGDASDNVQHYVVLAAFTSTTPTTRLAGMDNGQ